MKHVIDDFIRESYVDDTIIKKYEDIIPKEMIEFWKRYGFGSFLKGYLKAVNPDDFENLLKEGSERFHDATVLFATSMGDLIIWSDDFIRVLNFRYGVNDTVMSGFDFFFEDILGSTRFKKEDLKWTPYLEAVNLYGVPQYDECFGYVPILGAGGEEKVENLEKFKLKEHILIIIALVGSIY